MAVPADTWWSRFQQQERERVLGALAQVAPALRAGADDARARRAAEHGLARVLLDAVGSAWRRGWQPADLTHLARRERTSAELVLLRRAIGVELAGYPPSTIDPRWHAQLAEAGVRVAPATDDSWIHGGGGELQWAQAVTACVSLVGFLGDLVGVERLTALPGAASTSAAGAAGPPGGVDPRVLARVRALLAKAESTPYPAEAETFTAGAQALMARHSIDVALLAAPAPGAAGPEPDGVRIWIESPYEQAKVSLLVAVAEANRCRVLWRRSFGVCTVLGFPADIAAVETLFTSLLVQVTQAMTREGPRLDALGRSRTRSFRQSFLLSFAHRIGERLAAATRSAQEEAAAAGGDRLLPVLAERAAQVDRLMAELFPLARSTRSRVSAWDAEGWARGREAADRAALNASRSLPA